MTLAHDQPNKLDGGLHTPDESRAMARERIKRSCPRWQATVRYTYSEGLLELLVDFDSRHQRAPEDLAARISYCPVPYFGKSIVRTDLWVELYPLKAMAPPIVRMVRKGFDPQRPGRHYDLAECFFRIVRAPVELWIGEPEREAKRIDASDIVSKYPDCLFARPPRASDLLELTANAMEAWAYVPGARVNFRAIAWDRRFVPVGSRRREVA